MEGIPKSILSIPFIGTMMGIAMLYQIPIKVDEVDADYLKSTQELGLVFNKMYPQGNLKLKVISDRVIENKKEQCWNKTKTSVFFTGGVDATSALVETINLKPLLINIVGGDIALSNQKAHSRLEEYFNKVKNNIPGVDYCFVESNCSRIV